jgi:hypothetical protein
MRSLFQLSELPLTRDCITHGQTQSVTSLKANCGNHFFRTARFISTLKELRMDSFLRSSGCSRRCVLDVVILKLLSSFDIMTSPNRMLAEINLSMKSEYTLLDN